MGDGVPRVYQVPVWLEGPDKDQLAALLREIADGAGLELDIDLETGAILILCDDELTVAVALDELIEAAGTRPRIGAPETRYVQTVKRRAEVKYSHLKRHPDRRQVAHVTLRVEPGKGTTFRDETPHGSLPASFVAAVEKGVASVFPGGPAPFPGLRAAMWDVAVTMLDGEHDPDSPDVAAEIAARVAMREAAKSAGQVALEPIMALEITVPLARTAGVTGDMVSRRGRVLKQDERGDLAILHAECPATLLFGYFNALRSMTEGAGTYTARFSHYAPIPGQGPDDFSQAMALHG